MFAHHLISWGANSHGQLGQGILSEQCILPQKVDLSRCSLRPEAIKKIVGGAGHTLILDTDGNIYSCGLNKKGQTGNSCIEQENVLTFQQITLQLRWFNEIVVDICCGWDSSAALTGDGDLYVWGSNRYGQLGLDPSLFPMLLHPQRISLGNLFDKIECVSMGLRHTAIVTDSHELYISGANNRGQLGLINPITMKPYVLVSAFTKVPELIMQGNVQNVACGQYHTVVITKTQNTYELYVFGDNKHGQLGFFPKTSSEMRLSQPICIPLSGIRLDAQIQIHTGWSHTNILNNGTVFSWGRNDYGQLGRSSSNPLNGIPAEKGFQYFECIPRIIQLSVGSRYNFVLTDGTVWGRNDYGQLDHSLSNLLNGLPVEEEIQCIECIPRIIQLSIGSEHNVALTDDGAILCWGWNEHGNCGNGNVENILRPKFLPIPSNSVGVLVGAGAGHSFAVIKNISYSQ